jgi:hypothetical protein
MKMVGHTGEVFGLYELANDGTILYSRPRGNDGLHQPKPEVVGQDFFRDIVGCKNREDFRRHFRQFIRGHRPVDAFLFDCLFESQVIRTKVFMTRAYETGDVSGNEIVIMDIRNAGQ